MLGPLLDTRVALASAGLCNPLFTAGSLLGTALENHFVLDIQGSMYKRTFGCDLKQRQSVDACESYGCSGSLVLLFTN